MKPNICPFCGSHNAGELFDSEGYYVKCPLCGLTGPLGTDSSIALAKWNSIRLKGEEKMSEDAPKYSGKLILQPCPFCAGQGQLCEDESLPCVACSTCGAMGPDGTNNVTAVMLWNTRDSLISDSWTFTSGGGSPSYAK